MGETVKFRFEGRSYIATIGYYPDGRIGELFFVSGKTGTGSDTACRDLGIAVSLALQHGCALDTLRHACLLNGGGGHDGPLGKLLDILGNP